jgi:hypothetical protein
MLKHLRKVLIDFRIRFEQYGFKFENIFIGANWAWFRCKNPVNTIIDNGSLMTYFF